jgi:hypothetical protein
METRRANFEVQRTSVSVRQALQVAFFAKVERVVLAVCAGYVVLNGSA